MKEAIRHILLLLKIDLTKNLQYDRLTRIVLRSQLQKDSNCIDVGCHKGEILDMMIKYAPKGNHIGFEPIPELYKGLLKKYDKIAKILPFALSSENGHSSFYHVVNAPAYSGIKKRRYDTKHPKLEQIKVELRTLDELIKDSYPIDLIKIDVEGGEFDVLKGARSILTYQKPMLLFEAGKGSSEFYGTTADDLFRFLTETVKYQIFTLPDFVNQKEALDAEKFKYYFDTGEEYYYVAKTTLANNS